MEPTRSPPSASPPAAAAPEAAMEFFLDGHHVRLRSLVQGTYLHADEDGVGVSLRRSRDARATLNTAWRVQPLVRDGTTYVLFQSAAYGRYLALSPSQPIQRDYGNVLKQNDVIWEWDWEDVGEGDGDDPVFVRHVSDRRFLRAHGTNVAVDYLGRRGSRMLEWMVEAIPWRPAPPVLPSPPPNNPRRGRRTIRYFLGDLSSNAFQFYGRSVHRLRAEVARRANLVAANITLCVRPGFYGRLIPLVIDLPLSQEQMDIIVLTTGSPAAEALQLRYPDVDAP